MSVCAQCQGQPDLGHVVTLPLLTCHLAQGAQASLACFLFQKMLPCVCVLGGCCCKEDVMRICAEWLTLATHGGCHEDGAGITHSLTHSFIHSQALSPSASGSHLFSVQTAC